MKLMMDIEYLYLLKIKWKGAAMLYFVMSYHISHILDVDVTCCSVMFPEEENESTQVSDEDECREEPDPGRRYPEQKPKRP
ncbi:hypothetical protein AVEN_256303-1 [Araneus ventricosus]|uniref:Uncharacterized protein n=1 Tax=Araneus ventricosus TaxID=182803 RepID=A0A4Y2L7K9_ARAVE|nr:hypothetical protein AVEN_256303-1 [Araneus ventricosus]